MRLTTILVVLAALAVFALPAFASDQENEAKGLDAAIAAFEDGRLEECITACDAVDEKDDGHVKALYLRAESLLLLDRNEEAEKGFRAVLAESKKSVPARIGLGRSLAALGKLDDAAETLEEAIELDKKCAPAYRELGIVRIAQQKYSDARTELWKSWTLDATDPLTAIPLVDVHLGYKDTKGALKIARKLAKKRPESPVGHFLVGRVLELEGDWKDAIEAYERSVEADDTYLDAHRNLAIVCQTQNSMYRDKELLDKSMTHYARYFELGGDEPELRRIYDQMTAFLKWQEEQSGR